SPRQLELIVNGNQVVTTDEFGTISGAEETVYDFSYVINASEPTTIRIKNVGSTTTNKQTVVDNITWTASSSSASKAATPSITVTGIEKSTDVYFNTAEVA